MSAGALNHLIDRQRQGAAGFAADAAFKGRLLHGLSDVKLTIAAALGGNSALQGPRMFDLIPEERRYLDPEYHASNDALNELMDEDGNQILDSANADALARARQISGGPHAHRDN